MKLFHSLLVCLLLGISLGAIWDSIAVRKVRDGIQLFNAGDFPAAAGAFEAADSAAPDNATITFDRACTLTAQGELEEAKPLFQQAALSRETGLSSAAHYNLGNMSADAAKAILGVDPVNVDPGKREEVISGLLSATGHYRDCLRIQSSHAEARHNLELIRLFIKHIQAQWEQRDRLKAREELGLLEFLAMIEQRQESLRKVSELLAEEDNSPHRRQAMRETADAQRQLHEEIEPLKEKIAAELQSQTGQHQNQSGQQPPQTDDDRHQQIEIFLNRLADDAGDTMLQAADQVSAADLNASQQTQREVLDQLNEIFMVIAPFAQVLERSVSVQDGLLQTSQTIVESSDPAAEGESDEESAIDEAPQAALPQSPQVDSVELVWKQSRISDWGRLLSLKAQAELPQVEAQIESVAAQTDEDPTALPDPAASPDVESEDSSASEDPAVQLKSLVESYNKAIELAPQVEEHSASAEQHLTSSAVEQAVPDQREALRLLKEIAEPLSSQKQKNDQPQDQQNQNDENGQKQGSEQQEQTQQDEQNEKSDKAKQQEQQQQSLRERAESVLRRAREREKEHRDREKELKMILRSVSPVEKDW